MQSLLSFLATGAALTATFYLNSVAPNTGLPGSSPSKIPPVVYPSKPTAHPPHVESPPGTRKPVVTLMEKPFGMPGVIGLHNGKWEGTDYLGHVAKHISVDVEVLKGDKTPVNVDTSSLDNAISTLLKNNGFVPKADVTEGPPLPFLHVLVIIYPVEKDKFVVFTTTRLFEQIQVIRKDFKPAGYWQGITWENQDIILTNFEQLPTQIKTSAEALIKAFIDRYQLYNKEDIDNPTA
jgi:hypothetical protein